MKKIFTPSLITGGQSEVVIEHEDFFHMTKVLRVKRGETFIIGGSDSREWTGTVENISKHHLTLAITGEYRRSYEPSFSLTLFFSLLKGDKNDYMIQKCTEIGVDAFVPVMTKNSVIRLEGAKSDKKTARWQKIAREAAMQCNKKSVPRVKPPINISEITKYNKKSCKKIAAYYNSSANLYTFINNLESSPKDIYIFIGPEGDFDPSELTLLQKEGWEGVSCHSQILRSETAALFICSVLYHALSGRELF